jgi:hypothetical protein
METVRVHTLYPPFGCNQKNTNKRCNDVEKKGVLSSMIDAQLKKIRHGENADGRSAFQAMIITPIFEALSSKNCPMALPGFDAYKQHFDDNALSAYLLKFDRLDMGDGVLVSNVDYAGDSFSVVQYEKKPKKPVLKKAVKRSASPKQKAKRTKPKKVEDTSDGDNSFIADDDDEEVDDAHEDVDDEDGEVDYAYEAVDEDEEVDDTDEEGSEVDLDLPDDKVCTEVYQTIDWDRAGELVFIRKVSKVIAIADNHYPGLMHNIKKINDALQLVIHYTRTVKNMYMDIEDKNYMDQITHYDK